MSAKEKSYLTLYGTTATYSKIVGYCRKHKVHLTEPQVRKKGCVRKNCHALKKWDCECWARKDRIKQIKQYKKEAGIPPYQKVEIRTDRDGELLPVKEKR